MTFFSNLFGTPTKKAETVETPVNRSIFIDDEAPAEISEKPDYQPLSTRDLLCFDYETLGYSEGYSAHNIDIMQAKIQTIIADFRHAFSKEIDKITTDMRSIRPHLCDAVREAMPSEYLNLNAKYSDLATEKSEMQAQYELASAGEGICEVAISKYKLGFRKGYALWTDENLLKNHSK